MERYHAHFFMIVVVSRWCLQSLQ